MNKPSKKILGISLEFYLAGVLIFVLILLARNCGNREEKVKAPLKEVKGSSVRVNQKGRGGTDSSFSRTFGPASDADENFTSDAGSPEINEDASDPEKTENASYAEETGTSDFQEEKELQMEKENPVPLKKSRGKNARFEDTLSPEKKEELVRKLKKLGKIRDRAREKPGWNNK